MPRTYQPAHLPDGTPNPKHRRRVRVRTKYLPDGSQNPAYTPRRGVRPPDPPYRSKWDRALFVAWDGEGADIRGRHRYVLLQSSEGERAISPRGLDSATLLHTLAQGLAKHRNSIHVGFAFSYDVNMMLGDLPRHAIERLWAGGWVTWRRFRMQYRPRKSFTIHERTWNGERWVERGGVVWDVFGFFQSSFVKALKSYQVGDADVVANIERMKGERSDFKATQLPAIAEYCEQECRLLVELMQKLYQYLRDAELRVTRWDGAGAAAAALLKREGIKAYKGESPAAVLEASRHAYAGGRIEAVQYGHTSAPVYHYDIRSAYPAAMVGLPCLAHGHWVVNPKRPERERFAVCRVRYRFDQRRIYPFFWRAPDGAIYFPREGEGWYWLPEVRAAQAAMRGGDLGGELDILECWAWRRNCTCQPFGWLPELYEQRAQWKREGVGAEKALKLAINSLYGKTAQQVGGRNGKPPSYHQLEWAGWITSRTRALLYYSALPAVRQDALIMIATDALYTTVPLALDGDKLGGWEAQTHSGITVVQSGVYWTDDGEDAPAYCRGFDPGSLSRAAVLDGWRRGARAVNGSSSRFIGMGRALQGEKSWRVWCQWITQARGLALHPEEGKRVPTGRAKRPDRGMIKTNAVTPSWYWMDGTPNGIMSSPIILPWLTIDGAGLPPSDIARMVAADDESEDGYL